MRKKEFRGQNVTLERVNISDEAFEGKEIRADRDVSLDQLREVNVDSSEYIPDSRTYM